MQDIIIPMRYANITDSFVKRLGRKAAIGLLLIGVASHSTAAETARSADTFVDSIGVNVKWKYPDTPYGYAYEKVKQKLLESGIRHVRDSIGPRTIDTGKAGITTCIICEPDQGTPEAIRDSVKTINAGGWFIDFVEGPNEPDLFWVSYNKKYKGNGFMQGVMDFQKDLYKTFKSDPATAQIPVIGPSLGKTYGYETKSPFGKKTLTDFVDYGNFHPYPGGNPFTIHYNYATIDWYMMYGNFPSGNIDESPYAFDVYAPPFAPKPMIATETGYSNDQSGVTEAVHAKYMLRLFCEYFRKGIVRTYSHEFVDEFPDKEKQNREANFGLLRHDLTPKPAYTALKNLISVLAEKNMPKNFKPGTLDFTLMVSAQPGFDRVQNVHHLLLQKSTGEFYLVLWHEIANEDTSVMPHRQITPPDMPTTIIFGKDSVRSAVLYRPNETLAKSTNGMAGTAAAIKNSQIQIAVPDRIIILKLQTK